MQSPLGARGSLVGPLGQGGAAAAGPLVLDHFTGSGYALLTAHTPDIAPPGAAWLLLDATIWGLNNDMATNEGNSTRVAIDSGIANGTISVDIFYPRDDPEIVFRAVDANNLWVFQMLDEQYMRITEITDGVGVIRAAAYSTGLIPEHSRLQVRLAGSSILCEVLDPATGITLASASYSSAVHATATQHGMGAYSYSYFDDFQVSR